MKLIFRDAEPVFALSRPISIVASANQVEPKDEIFARPGLKKSHTSNERLTFDTFSVNSLQRPTNQFSIFETEDDPGDAPEPLRKGRDKNFTNGYNDEASELYKTLKCENGPSLSDLRPNKSQSKVGGTEYDGVEFCQKIYPYGSLYSTQLAMVRDLYIWKFLLVTQGRIFEGMNWSSLLQPRESLIFVAGALQALIYAVKEEVTNQAATLLHSGILLGPWRRKREGNMLNLRKKECHGHNINFGLCFLSLVLLAPPCVAEGHSIGDNSIHQADISVSLDRASPISDWGRLFGGQPFSFDGPLFIIFGIGFTYAVRWLLARDLLPGPVTSFRWIMGVTAFLSSEALLREDSTPVMRLTLVFLFIWAIRTLGYAEFEQHRFPNSHAFSIVFVSLILDFCVTASLSRSTEGLVAFFPPSLGCSLLGWAYVVPKLRQEARDEILLPVPATAA